MSTYIKNSVSSNKWPSCVPHGIRKARYDGQSWLSTWFELESTLSCTLEAVLWKHSQEEQEKMLLQEEQQHLPAESRYEEVPWKSCAGFACLPSLLARECIYSIAAIAAKLHC